LEKSCLLVLIALVCLSGCGRKNKFPEVTTVAGNGLMGSVNGKGTAASFANLMGITVDENGNIYIADSHNNLIRKISPEGLVTTLAGNGSPGSSDGIGNSASFFYPAGIAVDRSGWIYVADTHNSLIRKISPEGKVTTLVGMRPNPTKAGKFDTVKFDNPSGITVDLNGNIYLADWAKDLVRKISPGGIVTDLAGNGNPGSKDGQGPTSSFYLPEGIAVDAKGDVFVADTYNNMIRKINPNGVVATFAGKKEKGSRDGRGPAASFLHPAGLAIDKNENLYVADVGNNKIRKITPDGDVTTFAGTGMRGSANGQVGTATFYRPFGVAVDKGGNVYVADYQNNLVRKIGL
jgi:serine/threonine protein kinase, bacterial